MNQAPWIIKILIILSFFLMSAQIVLLSSKCKCDDLKCREDVDSEETQKAKRTALYLGEKKGIETEECVKLKLHVDQIKQRLATYDRLNSVVVSQDLSNIQNKDQDDFEALRGYSPRNEYDVIPFDSFDSNHLYGKVGTLSEKPVETPAGQRGVEFKELVNFAVKTINEDTDSKGDPVSAFQLAEGIMRNDRVHGTVYDLFFRSSMPDVFKKIEIFRQFAPLQTFGKLETVDTSKSMINVIIPLSGRIDKFEEFMKRFVDVGIRWDRRVFLTVVYFGMEGRDQVRSILAKIEVEENFKNFKVIYTSQEFSRGAGLQKGAEIWEGGNVLMFFCDVDIYFKSDFLERCRMHAAPGQKVYYPIVFSQYNPVITYGGESVASLEEQMRLTKDTGFWRDFGFGMSCQYRDDFLKVGGFDLTIKGWGMEDVKLYRSHLSSKHTVVRAYDRGIFHIYHKKKCQRDLSDGQFVSCLQSKAVAEGSHKQMGMLAFGKHIVGDTDPSWAKLLHFSLSAAAAPQGLTADQEKQLRLEQPGGDEAQKGVSKIDPAVQKHLAQTLFKSAVELKQILDSMTKKTAGVGIEKEISRMQELQLIVLAMSQNLLTEQNPDAQ